MGIGLPPLKPLVGLENLQGPGPGLVPGKPRKRTRQGVHRPIGLDHRQRPQAMAAADLEVHHRMAGGDLQNTRSELGIDRRIGDDRDHPVGEGDPDLLPHIAPVSFVVGMDGQGQVGDDSLRPRGGHHESLVLSVRQEVLHIDQLSDTVLVGHLHIRQGRETSRTPVDHALGPIEGAVFVKADKDLAHRLGKSRIHGESLVVPGERGAKPSNLVPDPGADGVLPLPDTRDKILAAQTLEIDAVCAKLFFHDILGGNAGVIHPGNPQNIVSRHPVVAGHHILDRQVEGMSHMKAAGDIGGRNHHRKGRVSLSGGGRLPAGEDLGLDAG